MELNPVRLTEEELAAERRIAARLVRVGVARTLLLLVVFGVAISVALTRGAFALVALYGWAITLSVIGVRKVLARSTFTQGERRFSVEPGGIRILDVRDGELHRTKTVRWSSVMDAAEREGSVDLALWPRGNQRIPAQAFADDEQRQEVLRRANGQAPIASNAK